jgi:type IV pilus assembly protein PilQ
MKTIPKSIKKRLKNFSIWMAVLMLLLGNRAVGGLSSQNHFLSPISLQFTDIEMTELLQVIAKLGNTNFLLSESIQGTISIDLRNTPWQTALHSILASRGLRVVRNGEIYWIGPHAEIQAFQKFRREDAALPF